MKPIIRKITSFAAALFFWAASVNSVFAGVTKIHTARDITIDTSSLNIKIDNPLSEKDWTIAIYLCGADLETENSSVTNDIIEMLEADIPDNINVLVMTGGTKKWNPYGAAQIAANEGRIGKDAYKTPDSAHTQIYSVDDDRMNLLYTFDKNLNMADPNTAAAFLQFASAYAPSKHTMTLFWDHGGGPLIGAENDEYTGEIMSVTELAEAVKKAREAFGKKLDIVGFDACFMSNIETAALLSPYADYLIAAEGDEPSTGWNYLWLNIFSDTAGSVSPVEIGKRIIGLCPAETKNGWEDAMDITLAMTDLSKIPAVTETVNKLGTELNNSLYDSAKYASIARAVRDLSSFGNTGLLDLCLFAYKTRNILTSSNDIINAVGLPPRGLTGEVTDGAVIYRGASRDRLDCTGLGIYYPTEKAYIGDNKEDTAALLDIYDNLNLSAEYAEYIKAITLKNDDKLGTFSGDIITGYNPDTNRFCLSVKNPDDLSYLNDVQVITKYTKKTADGSLVTYRLGTENAAENWDGNYFENPSDGKRGYINGEIFSYDVTDIGEYKQYTIPVLTDNSDTLALIVAYAPSDDPYNLEIDRIYAADSNAGAEKPYLPLYAFNFSTVLIEDSGSADYSGAGYLKNSAVSLVRDSSSERYSIRLEPNALISDEDNAYNAYFCVLDMMGNRYLSEPADISLLNRADYFFIDVNADDWFFGAVNYAYLNGLITGTAYRIFSPYMPLNRGMIAQIVYRAEGSPAYEGAYSFTDVSNDAYYAKAVAWAQHNGIVHGFDYEHFAPELQITREQLAKILYCFAKYKGLDISAYGDVSGYADAPQISEYAVSPILWAVGSGIIKGRSGTQLAPGAQVTRAETAAMLERFFGLVD